MDHFGIGQAVKGAVKVYFMSARQTGRTSSLVESLKNGDTVVFANTREEKRVRNFCKERDIKINTIVTSPKNPSEVFGKITVGKGRTIFDHSWVEQYYMNAIERAQSEIDHFQRETSGFGMAHIETKMQAMEMRKWPH